MPDPRIAIVRKHDRLTHDFLTDREIVAMLDELDASQQSAASRDGEAVEMVAIAMHTHARVHMGLPAEWSKTDKKYWRAGAKAAIAAMKEPK